MSEVATREPQLRFPEFSDSLIKGALGDYALIKRGAGSQYIEYSKDSKDSIRLIRIGDFLGGDAVFVRLTNAIQRFLLDEGDILIAGTGATAGITFLVPTKFVGMAYSYNAPKIKVHKDNVSFFYQYLISPKIKIQQIRLFTGNAQPFLDTNAIKGFSIFKPPLQEQQKIAAFLAAVDSKIEQLSKKQELLGEYKKGLMQQIFSQVIRFKAGDTPGQPLLPNGNSPSGSDFPNWEEKRLGDLCEITTGKLDANAMVEGGQYRFYTCAKEYYKIDDYAFDTDALIVSGNGANVGYIHHYQGKFNAYQRTYVLDSFTDNIIFVKFVLDEYLHKRIMKEKNEGNTPYIVMGTLTDMKINLPSFSEQTKIAIFLSSIDSKIEQVGKQLDESKQFKKALLQQMFV
ncbi:restriction endonuclease subunit S [Candidatus Thioglobus autotrophicus]|uniref:restriction endonuclease subunit S n=1 Tax=Candidatus Thioglobus autotrophicus TaxID=1705394 RepID=UPI00299E746D|nr:restriction endonuclease subunit S [Candidatus Thioglobus autotrophicus]WPE18692.1 restriction endonuclease subunit S [Candidatus Thioglobus autotrophicus]